MHYTGGWDSVSAVISRTWLYNWSLIDMKSSGLSQVVFYTCCCLRAEIAGGLPQSWCHLLIDVSVENALQQSVATISLCLRPPVYLCLTSSTIHLSFHLLCLNVSLSFSFYLHIDSARLSLKAFSTFGRFFSGRWKSSVCGGGREKLRVCLWQTGSHKRLHAFKGRDNTLQGGGGGRI